MTRVASIGPAPKPAWIEFAPQLVEHATKLWPNISGVAGATGSVSATSKLLTSTSWDEGFGVDFWSNICCRRQRCRSPRLNGGDLALELSIFTRCQQSSELALELGLAIATTSWVATTATTTATATPTATTATSGSTSHFVDDPAILLGERLPDGRVVVGCV
jgi:hypothetical protein